MLLGLVRQCDLNLPVTTWEETEVLIKTTSFEHNEAVTLVRHFTRHFKQKLFDVSSVGTLNYPLPP